MTTSCLLDCAASLPLSGRNTNKKIRCGLFSLVKNKKLLLMCIDFPCLQAISHPKFFIENWEDNIGASFLSSLLSSFLFLFFLLSFLSFLLSSSRMVYNPLENFPDWKRANLNELLSVLGVEVKKILNIGPWLPGRLWLPSPPERPTLPLVLMLEGGGEVEKGGDRRWWKPVIYFFVKWITLTIPSPQCPVPYGQPLWKQLLH